MESKKISEMRELASRSLISVGGQALIEGVMIRGPHKYVAAVRRKSRIVSKEGKIPSREYAFTKWPFIRGFVNLVDMLAIGIRSLMWSAQQAAPKEEKIGKPQNSKNFGSRKSKDFLGNELAFTILISIGFAIIFFIALPYFLTNLIGITEEKKPVLFNIVDGIIRILFFLIYIAAISFMKDVRVLFQYHGAEHKAIHCYENNKKLSIANAKKFTTLHPRCGTSFLLIVFIVSIFVFSLLPAVVLHYYPNFLDLNHWARKGILFPVRILLLPLIAGISYEILKISGKYRQNFLFRLVTLPGLALQKITTKEPNAKQTEVAIYSLKKLLEIERK